MLTKREVEMLATLLTRVGVNAYEMVWANAFLDKLRAIAARDELEQKKEVQNDD